MEAKRSKERLHDLLENSDQGEILYPNLTKRCNLLKLIIKVNDERLKSMSETV